MFLLVVAALIIILIYFLFYKKEAFYTEFNQEEPTRSHTPYVGTIPFGSWGTSPWAVTYPRYERPHNNIWVYDGIGNICCDCV